MMHSLSGTVHTYQVIQPFTDRLTPYLKIVYTMSMILSQSKYKQRVTFNLIYDTMWMSARYNLVNHSTFSKIEQKSIISHFINLTSVYLVYNHSSILFYFSMYYVNVWQASSSDKLKAFLVASIFISCYCV